MGAKFVETLLKTAEKMLNAADGSAILQISNCFSFSSICNEFMYLLDLSLSLTKLRSRKV